MRAAARRRPVARFHIFALNERPILITFARTAIPGSAYGGCDNIRPGAAHRSPVLGHTMQGVSRL